MIVEEQELKGVYLIQPRIFEDDRGYFMETFHHRKFREQTGLQIDFVQDNESKSDKGILRGLHFQNPPFAQAKLVRVIKGRIFDVAVDIRPDSSTFGQWIGVELTEENKWQLFIPHGFAHGFLALENNTIVNYKCDAFYSKEHEGAVRFDDPEIGIEWNFNNNDLIISQKDLDARSLASLLSK